MKIGSFDTREKVLVVAEVGNNHEGSYALAEEMVGRAAEAGAGAVKFQTFRTEHYVSASDEARFKRLKSFELKPADFEKLAAVARRAGILFISTPFDLQSAEVLAPLVDAYKISSSDNTFYPLMEKVAKVGKPVIVSCGLSGMEEVVHSASYLRRVWREAGISQDLAVLHCVSAYPVPPEDASLLSIRALRKALPDTIGYSDHTLGVEAALLAVTLGAEIIEKHFTLDKNQSDFRDHKISSDPVELRQLVDGIVRVRTLLGKRGKEVQASEKGGLTAMRRSIVAAQDMAAGETITWDKITWTRPAGGLPPGRETSLLGEKLRAAVKAGDKLGLESLA
ncbi:MAG: N-acetylneuraminate synthase family protein [Fibrobacteria bacterium]